MLSISVVTYFSQSLVFFLYLHFHFCLVVLFFHSSYLPFFLSFHPGSISACAPRLSGLPYMAASTETSPAWETHICMSSIKLAKTLPSLLRFVGRTLSSRFALAPRSFCLFHVFPFSNEIALGFVDRTHASRFAPALGVF